MADHPQSKEATSAAGGESKEAASAAEGASKGATSKADDEIMSHETLGMSSKGKFMFQKFVILVNIDFII